MCSGRPQADTGLNSNSTLPYAWMLCGVIAFSVMAALTHMLGGLFEWNLVATARTGLALTISAALTYWAGAKFVFWGPRALWIRSIAGSVSLLCTFYALPRLPISDVLTLTNMFPIWVALLSWPLVGETPSLSAWLAIALGMVGVVLVAQPHLVHDEKLPAAMAVVASLSTAVSMLGLHRLQQIDPRAIVVHFSFVSLLACLASLVVIPQRALSMSQFDGRSISMLLVVGVTATIGQIFLTKAFAAGSPAKVSVVALSQVAFAMTFDAVVEGRTFGVVGLIGIALVLAPTAWLIVSAGRFESNDL
jgi:drug/metabolite transporter (DMT)-like permease